MTRDLSDRRAGVLLELLAVSAVADKLDEARALIEPRGAWVQDSFALDSTGRSVSPISSTATCFCALGAIANVADAPTSLKMKNLFRRAINNHFIAEWNDTPSRRKRQVVNAFKRAAELARAGEQ